MVFLSWYPFHLKGLLTEYQVPVPCFPCVRGAASRADAYSSMSPKSSHNTRCSAFSLPLPAVPGSSSTDSTVYFICSAKLPRNFPKSRFVCTSQSHRKCLCIQCILDGVLMVQTHASDNGIPDLWGLFQLLHSPLGGPADIQTRRVTSVFIKAITHLLLIPERLPGTSAFNSCSLLS